MNVERPIVNTDERVQVTEQMRSLSEQFVREGLPMATGKLYVMQLVPSGWAIMTDAEPADLFGIPCVRGVSFTTSEDSWARDKMLYVPTAHIQTVVIVDSVEEYREWMRRSKVRRRAPRRPRSAERGPA